jgi:hypothetical protein
MSEVKPTWQTYVTTIHCDFINDFDSLMVKKNWTARCTGTKSIRSRSQKEKRKLNWIREREDRLNDARGLCAHTSSAAVISSLRKSKNWPYKAPK